MTNLIRQGDVQTGRQGEDALRFAGCILLGTVAWSCLFLVLSPCQLVTLSPSLTDAYGQQSVEELRREQIETIEAMKATEDISGGSSKLFGTLGRRTGWAFTYGASLTTSYTGGDNGSDRSGTTPDATDHNYDYEIKPFINVSSADRKSKFYVRGTSKYTETSKNGQFGGATRGNNYIQPTVDMLYWEKEFTREKSDVKSKLTVGRQFVQVGRGIAYAATADGLHYELTGLGKKNAEFKMFAVRKNRSDDRFDASGSGSGRSKGLSYGMRVKYPVHPKAKMMLYGVHVIDKNPESDPGSAIQKHKFEPQYYGVVSEGRITKDLQYWGEFIAERGKTYARAVATTSPEVDIKANALVAGMKYYFGGDLAPTMFGEYASATGDPDALGSTTTTSGGSSPGTKDSRFNSLGGLSMGFALSPSMTNMVVYKLGASVKPLGRSANKLIQDISFQPEYYKYQRRTGKLGAAGNDSVLSTAASTTTTDDIGSEYNVSVNWRLWSDMVYSFRYGRFTPGDAYPAATRSKETYMKFKVSIDL